MHNLLAKCERYKTSGGQNVHLKIAFSPKWGIANLGQNDLTEIVESRLDSSEQNANLIEVTLLIINEVTSVLHLETIMVTKKTVYVNAKTA